jgi:N-acetylneuraminate synthase
VVARFIAEIGSNHNRDPGRLRELIKASAAAGCQAVKLQVFRVEDLFAPEALAAHPQLAERRAWEFPLALLPDVRAACDEAGLGLGATPFGLWAVEAVNSYVDFYKVGSYELLWHDLLRACAATGKPLIISTGMATEAEVAGAVEAVEPAAAGGRLTLLHCVSGYPTSPEQANLAAIETLRGQFGCPVGWSDHTGSEEVVIRAVARWQASDVELHIDLDGTGFEAGGHNWNGPRIARLRSAIDAARLPETSALDGDGRKRPQPVEQPDVPWRADPADGLRPLRELRAQLAQSAVTR